MPLLRLVVLAHFRTDKLWYGPFDKLRRGLRHFLYQFGFCFLPFMSEPFWLLFLCPRCLSDHYS